MYFILEFKIYYIYILKYIIFISFIHLFISYFNTLT